MTDHNSPAGAVGAGQPSGQPGSFGPPQQPGAWEGQAQGQQVPAAHPAPSAQPQHLPSDAARAQVAAAWVRTAPQAGQAAVPSLPPRETRPPRESKKEKRERERAARKAAYEEKKAARKQRGKGTVATPAATPAPSATPAATVAPSATPATTAPAPGAGNPTLNLSVKPDGLADRPAASSAAHRAADGESAPTATPAPAAAKGDFAVPKPGGRIPSGGRRTHVALRATLLITTCVFALGSCGVMGLMAGKSSGPGTAGLDAADAEKYRLTTFPTQQAATFAELYASLCMTYSPETATSRRQNLARYASAGVDPECGWNGHGTSRAVSATWDGTVEELPEYDDHGRYLGVQVRTEDGTLTRLTVPVYVRNLQTGEGIRVAGDVGQMPLPTRADVPKTDRADEVVDEELSQQLRDKVLPGYFQAWGASDATAMSRFTVPDATDSAKTGLAGRLENPAVSGVEALVPPSLRNSDPYAYKDGQSVEVRVVVDWGDPDGEAVRRSYRMTVVNTAQGWFIKDIRGGVPDADGGRADADAPAPTDSAAPSGSAEESAGPDSGTGSGASQEPEPSASATTAPQSAKAKRPAKS